MMNPTEFKEHVSGANWLLLHSANRTFTAVQSLLIDVLARQKELVECVWLNMF